MNPFDEEEKRAVQNMSEGTKVILSMHNTAELSALCGTMCLAVDGTNKEKTERVQGFIGKEVVRTRNPEKAYSNFLHLVWEGILFEYLRSQGSPLKSGEHDPRVFTILFWRKRALQQQGGTFRPHYMPRLVRPRFINEKLDDDLRALLNGVSAKEVYVKESEKRIKSNSDYRNVVMYLAAVTDMHDFEQDARSYLMGEVNMLRGRADHMTEALALNTSQALEMEGKHHVMAEQWCRTVAAQEASVDAYMGMLNDLLCESNALAGTLQEFLESHGGREGNRLHPTLREKLSGLVPRLLARYHFDLHSASEEAKKDKERLDFCDEELARQKRVLRFETERADAAERECERWRARHGALQTAAAQRMAQLEEEASWLYSESGSGLVERFVQERRFDMVRPAFEAMLLSGKADEEAKGAGMLEALGIMDRQGINQLLEGRAMRREELEQRGAVAVALAEKVAPPPSGASSKGEEGKGPKKIGGKKKK